MTTFVCRVLDTSGQVIEESREADSLEALTSLLESQGLTPLSIKPRERLDQGEKNRHRSFKAHDLAVFSRQLATMIASAVSIDSALGTLADNAKPEHSEILRALAKSIHEGASLSEALGRFPNTFPRAYVATIAASERVGQLDLTLRELAESIEWESRLRRDVRGALQYPATVVVTMVVAIIVLQQVVVPQFQGFFARLGGELPLPTQLLFGSANIVSNYWWALLAGVALAVVWFRRSIRSQNGRMRFDRVVMAIPLIGSIVHRMHLARFSRTFSLLQGNGLPILTTLELIQDTTSNSVLANQISQVRDDVGRGESLGDSVGRHDVFTPMVGSMIRVGENSGKLDASLDMVSQYYEEETRTALRDLTRWIEPILTLVLGAFVLFLALAIFLPWWDMTGLYRD